MSYRDRCLNCNEEIVSDDGRQWFHVLFGGYERTKWCNFTATPRAADGAS